MNPPSLFPAYMTRASPDPATDNSRQAIFFITRGTSHPGPDLLAFVLNTEIRTCKNGGYTGTSPAPNHMRIHTPNTYIPNSYTIFIGLWVLGV